MNASPDIKKGVDPAIEVEKDKAWTNLCDALERYNTLDEGKEDSLPSPAGECMWGKDSHIPIGTDLQAKRAC